jgi:preprotein translocase subunit SecG
MFALLTVIYLIVCLFLVVVVLLQSGEAADLAGAFGGMGSQTVSGRRGSATLLSRATTVAAALFMITSLSLSIIATRNGGGSSAGGLLDQKHAPISQPAVAQPKPGETTQITVTPGVDGIKGTPQNIQAPMVPDPTKKQPDQKE